MKIIHNVFTCIADFIRRDFLRKFIALLLAVVVYWFVSSKLNRNDVFENVPVSFKLNSPHYCLSSGMQVVASVKVKHNLPFFRNKRRDDYVITRVLSTQEDIDLYQKYAQAKNAEERKGLPPLLRKEDVFFSDGTSPDRWSIKGITLKSDHLKPLRKTGYKEVEIDPVMTGCFPGYRYDFDSQTVTISGPEEELKKIDKISTNEFQANYTQDFNKTVGLDMKEVEKKGIVVEDAQVLIKVRVSTNSKTFNHARIRILANEEMARFNYEMKLDPENVQVTIAGAKSKVREDAVHPYVDVSQLDLSDTKPQMLPVQLFIDKQVEVQEVTVSPEEVKVTIRKLSPQK